jgi:iron complex transport system substrate-binding protein
MLNNFSAKPVILAIIMLVTTLIMSSNVVAKEMRIVVSGGSITEIIYGLGEQDKIVGVDSTSVYPEQAKQKPQVGYVRRIASEGVLSLNPTLLLGEEDTGPPKVLAQLQQTGLPNYIFTKEDNYQGIEAKIRKVASLLEVPEKGEQLVSQVTRDRETLDFVLKQTKNSPKVLFILSMRSGQPIVAGQGTSAAEIMSAVQATNVAAQLEGWKAISTEAVLEMNPDVILIMSRHGNDAMVEIAKQGHFKFTNAVKNKRVYSFDGTYLLGMNPRTPKAVIGLATKLYPEVKLPSGYVMTDMSKASE